MPLYEYRCSKCGNVFETLQKYSDAPLKKHPVCGGKVERLISTSGLHFKGSGFYITDYKGGSGKKADGGDSKPAEGSATKESKTETKTETKTESKKESKPAPAAKSD